MPSPPARQLRRVQSERLPGHALCLVSCASGQGVELLLHLAELPGHLLLCGDQLFQLQPELLRGLLLSVERHRRHEGAPPLARLYDVVSREEAALSCLGGADESTEHRAAHLGAAEPPVDGRELLADLAERELRQRHGVHKRDRAEVIPDELLCLEQHVHVAPHVPVPEDSQTVHPQDPVPDEEHLVGQAEVLVGPKEMHLHALRDLMLRDGWQILHPPNFV
mmetsp:Transcript_48671/g.129913  ORF Transcript_48671/g.129913 Transcript_48671/m.129913 type:complete len:222 (+) Transcript_48671:120-785(+)